MTEKDALVLRDLARRFAEIAADQLNAARRELWYAHDRSESERPIVLVETDAGLQMVAPGLKLECEEEWARGHEARMRSAIVHFEVLRDDRVVEPWAQCGWVVDQGGYGVETRFERGTDAAGGHTGYRWDAPLEDLERDFGKLKPRAFSVDRASSDELMAATREVFDGVLGVRRRGGYWWTMGLTQQAVYLAGLEKFMLYTFESPEALHRLMAFLRDDHLAFVEWLEQEGLLTLNNENDYTGSGSAGYTRDLPRPDLPEGAPPRARDLWVLVESQETVGFSPAQFEEFVFPYQEAIAARFGKVYYGCCEPVHGRWGSLARMSNLARVSVSPWADEAFMAEKCAEGELVYSRKPSPALVSTGVFDEDAIRADLRKTLEVTRAAGATVEIVMKDVHTLSGEPWRLARWIELAREEIDRGWR